jgi:hypothetical protein
LVEVDGKEARRAARKLRVKILTGDPDFQNLKEALRL